MRRYKVVLLILLAANALWFALGPSPSKAIDACAWLLLLVLFVAEADYADRLQSGHRRVIVRTVRLAAGVGVIGAAIGYVLEDDLLDAVNSLVWIAVVIVLEIELRLPLLAARARRTLNATARALYAGLGVLVLLWAMQGLWMDAYDAVLWLAAFVIVELDIVSQGARSAQNPAAMA